MTELFIQEQGVKKEIALLENGRLIEYYEENTVDDNSQIRKEGNIYIGIIRNVLKGMQAAFVDIGTEKNAFIHLKDLLPKVDETKQQLPQDLDISQLVKPGDKILVQVKKDSNEKKGARVSTHINLPSKYIALMPNTDIITVSQKIEDEKERERLKKLAKEHLSEENGVIVRTSAENKTQEVIDDIAKTEAKWNSILETSVDPDKDESQLLYKSEDIVEKILIDLVEKDLERIVVNTKKLYDEMLKVLKSDKQYSKIKLELMEKDNIFDTYDIEKQIQKSLNRKIWLRCGGFITIDKTEALTAIDVNTGKYTGVKDAEKTIFRVNKEATIEIAKQLRLRDIGGVIIIDYIDMADEEDKNKIENLLKEELKKDRTKTQVEGWTKLDLMELTRKHIWDFRTKSFENAKKEKI